MTLNDFELNFVSRKVNPKDLDFVILLDYAAAEEKEGLIKSELSNTYLCFGQ